MKNNGLTAAAVILMVLLVAGAGSAAARQTTPSVTASPLMKAMQTTAVFRSAEKITQFENNLNWINETRTRNEYQAGMLATTYEDMWVGEVIGDWQPFIRYEFTYAPDGTLASETVFEWDSSDWRPFERTLYDGTGGVFTRILVQAPDGAGGWVDVEQSTYVVENDLVVAGQTDQWLGEWTPVERFTYVEVDNSVIETTERPNGTTWMNAERTIYPGLSLFYLHREFERLLDEFSELEGMLYAIRLPELVSQNWDGTDWVNELRIDRNATLQPGTFYIVDETTTTEEWDGSAWVPTGRTFTEFDTSHQLNGLPSRMSLQIWDGTGWVEFGSEQYILRTDLRKIAQSTLSMDLGNGMNEVSRVRIEWSNVGSVDVENPEAPVTFVLSQNVPNPFNPSTRIGYTLQESQEIRLTVHDLLGRQIDVLDSGFRSAGEHAITWDASAMPSGMYLYRLETAGHAVTRTMVLMK